MALVLVLFAILASYIGPAINFFDAWRDSKAEHANLAALRRAARKLHKREADLEGPGRRRARGAQAGHGRRLGERAAYVVNGHGH